MILFLVRRNTSTFLTMAASREVAKHHASKRLLGDPDTYEVTPLTRGNETIHIDLPVHVLVAP